MRQSVTREELAMQRRSTRAAVYGYLAHQLVHVGLLSAIPCCSFQNDESEDQRKEQLEKRNMAPKARKAQWQRSLTCGSLQVRIVDGQIVVEKESIVYTTNTLAGPR